MNPKNYFRQFAVTFVMALFTISLVNGSIKSAKNNALNNVTNKTNVGLISNNLVPLPPALTLTPLPSCTNTCCSTFGNVFCGAGVDATGGTPPYVYTWSNGATGQCVAGLFPGAYTVTVTDALGATASYTFVISQGPCCQFVCPNDTIICFQVPDSAIHLGMPTVGPKGAGQPDPCKADTIWNNSTGVYPVGTTVVTWYVRYASGVVDTCNQNITRLPPSNVVISFTTTPAAIAGVINICNGQSITFTDNSTGTTGRLWDFGNGYYSSNQTHTQVYTFPPGSYTVKLTVYDACGNTYDTTLTVIVDPNAGPDIECISVVCAGDTSTYKTNANCTVYNWSVTGGVFSPLPTTSSTSVTVIWGAGPIGTISLSVSGCTPPSTCNVATVKKVSIVPSTMAVMGNPIVCAGSNTCYKVECIAGNAHTWSLLPATAGTITGQGMDEICIQWTPGFFGNVTLTVNYVNVLTGSGCNLPDGCVTDHGCMGSGTLTIQVRPIFGISGPSKVCPNAVSSPFNGMNLTNNTVAPGTSWKLVTPVPSTITFANSALLNAYTWPTVGVYTLTAYAPPGIYCNDSAKVNVEVVEIKTPNIIAGLDTVCPGSTHFYTVQPNMSGVQYIWTVTGAGTPLGVTTTGSNSIAITWGAGGGTVSCQQQLIANPFCISNSTAVFTVVTWPPFALPVITPSATVVCLKTAITYCIPPVLLSNATYTWSVVPPSAGNIITSNGGNCVTIQWVSGTSAIVKLNISRCYNDSVQLPVTLLALPPVPSISVLPSVICKNSPVNFSTTSIQPNYFWNFGDGFNSTLQNPTHTYTTAGNFNVSLTVTNANGCSDTAFTSVHVEDVPVLPVIIGNAAVCVGSFANYSFAEPFFAGGLYTWSLSSGGSIVSGQGTNSINVQWTATGSHQVLLSVTSLCPAGIVVPFNVTVNPLPVPVIGVPSPLCMGASLTFTGSGGGTYSWSFPGASSVNLANPAAPVVVYNVDGVYSATLTVTDANGCSATTTSIYTVHELPIAFITTPDPNGCNFPYPVSIYAVNSGGYSYNWIPTATTGPVLSTLVAATTTYSVLVTNQYGCTKMSNAITFTNGNCGPGQPQPGDCVTSDSINFTWSPPLCLSATFTASGSVLPVPALSWNFDYLGATGTGNPVSNTYTYPGFYKVVVCGEGRGFIYPALTVPCPNVTICKMRPVKIPFDARFKVNYACNGANQMQTIITNTSIWAGSDTYTWKWFIDGSPFSILNVPPVQINPPFTPGPHNVTLIISDPTGTLATCTLTVPIIVPVPIVASFTSPAQVCKGFAAAFLDTSTPSAVSRSWTSAGAASTTTNPANLIYTVAGPTSVTLNVSDNYGCASSASAPVNVQMGTGTLTVVNNNSCDSVQLTASGNPNYVWTYFSPVPSVLASSVYVKASGYYSVTAIDPANGCPYSATTPLVTVKQPPIAVITGKIKYCQGENLDLKTSSAGTVVWYYDADGYTVPQGTLPNMTNVASVPGSFIYRVIVTGANGCTASANISIVVDPVPASASIVGGPTTFCDGDSVQLSVSPPGATYLWSVSPPPPIASPANTGATLWVTKGGTYSVIVQTVNGCYYPAIAPKVITVNPVPQVAITGDTVLCQGETLTLTTISIGGATYLWSGPAGGGAGNPLQINNMPLSGTGTYTVTVTNVFGCTKSGSINVIVHPNPIVPIIAANVPGVLCEGQLYTDSVTPPTIDGSLNPLDYKWNTGQQGYKIFAAKAGDYFVTATNQWGCSSVSNVLTIHPNPDLSCVPTGCYDFCTECDSVEIPGPFGFASYQWQIITAGVYVNYSNTQNLKVYVPGGKFRLIAYNIWGCADSSDTLSIQFHDCCTPIDTAVCVDTVCQYFSGTSLQGFGPYPPAPNLNILISNTGGQYPGDQYLRVTDLAGPSAVLADTSYNGKWCCGKFCYDFKIFDDGVTTTVNVQPKIRIYNSVLGKGFEFTSSLIINENSPWTRINVCAGLDSLPVNPGYGIWTPITPATAADWTAVASNVTSVVIQSQINSNNNEVVGIDNVCFVPENFVISCNKVVTCAGTSVNVTVLENGGCDTYRYLWSNGATTASINFVQPGTYCVTVRNCCGCVDSCCVTVVLNPDTLHVTDTIYQITCDSIFGAIDVTVVGGALPYTYDWSNGITTQDRTGLTAGIYTLTVTDGNGCEVIRRDTIIVQTDCNCDAVPPPPGPTMAINSIVGDNCNQSGCIHATFTGCCLRYSYTYYDPCNPGLSYSVAQSTDSLIFCNLKAGTYVLNVQDACGNLIQQTVVVPLLNGPMVVNVQYSNCADSICLNVTGGCAPYTYNWLGGATTSCIKVTNTCIDSYVTVTDSRGCSELVYYTVPGISFPNIVRPTCCDANGMICVEVCLGQQPYFYSWNTTPVQTTRCATGLAAGTYCVTVTNANGLTVSCCYTLLGAPITPPTISFVFGGCGSNVTALIKNVNCDYTIHWENGTSSITRDNLTECDSITLTVVMCDGTIYTHGSKVPHITAQITPANCLTGIGSICVNTNCFGCSQNTYSWQGNAVCPGSTSNCFTCIAGTYTVCITNCQGDVVCCPYTIPATQVMVTTLVSKVNPTSLLPLSGAININTTGGYPAYTYLWSNGSTMQNQTGLPIGTYTVTVTDAFGCTNTLKVVLKLNCQLTYSTIIVQKASCYLNNGIATVVPSGGSVYTYAWFTTPVQTTATATGLAYGVNSYVTITDISGCAITATIIVPTSTGLSVTLNSVNVSCNGGTDGSITSTVSGSTTPYIYQWSNGATTANVSGLSAGTYTLIVTSGNCDAVVSIKITQPKALILSISTKDAACGGASNGSATVTVTGGTPPYSYIWNTVPVQTGATATGLASGIYHVKVTDSKPCTKTTSAIVNSGGGLVVNGVSTNVSCFGGTNGTVTLTVSGGGNPYVYLWSNGSTNKNLLALAAGTYTVTVTSANGCTQQLTFTITQPSALTATATSTAASCYGGKNGTASVIANGGTPGYTYSWNTVPVQTTATATGLKKGTYTCTIKDSKGCVKIIQVTVTEPSSIAISITKTNVNLATGSNGTATATANGGMSPYLYEWSTNPLQTTQTATGLNVGTYTVTVIDANGCTKTKSVNISANAKLAANVADDGTPYSALFPNPTTGYTTITFNDVVTDNVTVDIFNTSGQIVYTAILKPGENSNSFEIDLSSFAKGIYTVKYQNNHKHWIDKLVIQ